MKNICGIVCLIFCVIVNVHAEDTSNESNIQFSCITDNKVESIHFKEIQKAARKVNQSICDAILVPTRKSITDGFPRDEVTAFGILVKKNVKTKFQGEVLKALEEEKIGTLDKQLNYFVETLSTGVTYPKAMPRFNVLKGGTPRAPLHHYFFTGAQEFQGEINREKNSKCKDHFVDKPLCSTVLQQLDDAIFPYQRNANAFTAYDTRIKLNALSAQWDAYFDSARAQTFADIFLTTLIEKSHFKTDHLVGPPERQWFLFRPNIVLEYIENAPDGENMGLALSIEWIGVNWWRDSIIGIPFGVSATTLYSDRPEVKDVGHGVTLYFDNKYAIGYVNHDGNAGFFASVDLFKLFEDKSKQVDRYKDAMKEIVEEFQKANVDVSSG